MAVIAEGGKRVRRIGVVAMTCRLFIVLQHYLELGSFRRGSSGEYIQINTSLTAMNAKIEQ